jgi:ectoine hydroxylase-related dioxygenase (phytanoyl-CoA dioxygenase family)
MLNGYVVYKKKLSKEEQEFALSSIQGDKVDYSLLKTFIDNYFLPKIPFENPIYLKARISNNNNSNDASLLHSDVYNFTAEKEIPMYTALCYFDKAQLELIPRSHIKPHDSFMDEYSRTIVLDLDPGDIVVFNSVTVHRGVNYSQNNRRVLQVFEIFPSNETYKQNVSKLLTVDTSNKSKNSKKILYYIAQIKWLVDIVNCIVFFLGYYNLKYKFI